MIDFTELICRVFHSRCSLAELYRRKVAALHQALEDDPTREEAMELIRSLIDAIVLVPYDGRLRIEVRGDLAAILAFGEGRKNPGQVDRDSAEQIKVVAGERNHLYRTVLRYQRR